MNQDLITAKIVSEALHELATKIANGVVIIEKFNVESDGMLKVEIVCCEGDQPVQQQHITIGAHRCPKCDGVDSVDAGDGKRLCLPCNVEF